MDSRQRLNVRFPPDLAGRIVRAAATRGLSLNAFLIVAASREAARVEREAGRQLVPLLAAEVARLGEGGAR